MSRFGSAANRALISSRVYFSFDLALPALRLCFEKGLNACGGKWPAVRARSMISAEGPRVLVGGAVHLGLAVSRAFAFGLRQCPQCGRAQQAFLWRTRLVPFLGSHWPHWPPIHARHCEIGERVGICQFSGRRVGRPHVSERLQFGGYRLGRHNSRAGEQALTRGEQVGALALCRARAVAQGDGDLLLSEKLVERARDQRAEVPLATTLREVGGL